MLEAPDGWRRYINLAIEEEKAAKLKKQAELEYQQSPAFVMDQYFEMEASIRENPILRNKFAALRERIEREPEYKARFQPQVLEAIFSLDLEGNDEF